MFVQHEITASQLYEAYLKGQRRFNNMEVVGQVEPVCLSEIDLRNAEFIDCWFHSASFVCVDLRQAIFSGCNLKCTTFESCKLDVSRWSKCAICAIAIINSSTDGLQASDLDAYGFAIDSADAFLEYAGANAVRRS